MNGRSGFGDEIDALVHDEVARGATARAAAPDGAAA
jgi:hypothetical protein